MGRLNGFVPPPKAGGKGMPVQGVAQEVKNPFTISPLKAFAFGMELEKFPEKVHSTMSGMASKLYSWILNLLLPTPARDASVYDQLMLMGWLGDAGYQSFMRMEGIDVKDLSYKFLTITTVGADGKLRIDPAKLGQGDIINTSYLRSQVAWPGIGELYQLWNRGLIEDALADKIMRSHGYADSGIREKLAELRYNIPSDNELIQYAAKQSFNRPLMEKYGYFTEVPTYLYPFSDANGFGGKTGINFPAGKAFDGKAINAGMAKWFDINWANHWTLPIPQEGYRMLQTLYENSRYGASPLFKDGLSFSQWDLNNLYQAANVPPYWRDRLTQLSWNTLAKRDVNILYKDGIIGKEQVYHAYRLEGYRDEDAERLANHAVKLKHDEDIHKYGVPATKHVCMAMQLGVITEDFATNKIADLLDDKQLAEIEISNCKSDSQLRRMQKRIAAIDKRFANGEITLDETRRHLNVLGIIPEKVQEYLDDWIADKELSHVQIKAGELTSWYHDGLISKNEAFARLINLGYSQSDATIILVRVDGKILEAQAKAKEAAVKKLEAQAAKMKAQEEKEQKKQEAAKKKVEADKLKTEKEAQKLLAKQLAPFNDKNLRAWYMRKLMPKQSVQAIFELRGWTKGAIDLWFAELEKEIATSQIAQSKPKTPSQVTEG